MNTETIEDVVREMRKRREMIADAAWSAPLCCSTDSMTAQVEILDEFIDRIEAAHKRETDSIHHAMVILAGIEMDDSANPPRLWTALEDAYDALSDALGTDGDTTADVEEAKASGRHFVVGTLGNAAKMREALKYLKEASREFCHLILNSKYNAIMDKYKYPEVAKIRDAIANAGLVLAEPPRNCDVYTEAQLCEIVTKEAITEMSNSPQEVRDIAIIVAEGVIKALYAEAKGVTDEQ